MYEKIVNLLAEQTGIDAENITEESTFEELGIDSLDTVELVMQLEEELGVELEITEKMQTVGEFVKFVEEKTEK